MPNIRKEFGKIYDKYVAQIYRFIFLKVNSQEIAEDLCSEVFTRGWNTFQEKKYDIENIRAFLYQIARNLIVDHYREKGQARLVSVESAPKIADLGASLEEKAILDSDMEQVKAALAVLREDYREVIIWYYLDELSVPEIAKMLKKSETATRVQIHRAIQALKVELQL